MTMDQAANFLAGSILSMIGFVVIIIGVIIVNNLLHNFWKPVKIFTFSDLPPARFATDEELTDGKPEEKRNEIRKD